LEIVTQEVRKLIINFILPMGILTAIVVISLNLILFHIQKKIQQKINPNFYKPKKKYYQKYKKHRYG
jgi:hypothetical protein